MPSGAFNGRRSAPGRPQETARTADGPKPVETLEQAERRHIISALESSKWVIGGPAGAAERLGMKRSTLQFRMKKLGISKP